MTGTAGTTYIPRSFENDHHERFVRGLARDVQTYEGRGLAETVRGAVLDYSDLPVGSFRDYVTSRAKWARMYLTGLKRSGAHDFSEEDFAGARDAVTELLLQYGQHLNSHNGAAHVPKKDCHKALHGF